MAVSVQPEAQDSEKSGLALGAGLPYLHVLTVNARLGQTVTGGAPLLTFEMPPDRVISERDHLSRAKLDALERSLAGVNYQLAMATGNKGGCQQPLYGPRLQEARRQGPGRHDSRMLPP